MLRWQAIRPTIHYLNCRATTSANVSLQLNYWRHHRRQHRNRQSNKFYNRIPYLIAGTGPFTLWQAFKDYTGIEKIELDKDPIHAKIKECILYRKYDRYEDALKALHEAIRILNEENQPRINKERTLTYIYIELGNTFHESQQLEEAEKTFTAALHRILHVDKQPVQSPEYILVSLRLAEVMNELGNRKMAEVGYQHVIGIQKEITDRHIAHHHSWKNPYKPRDGTMSVSFGNTYRFSDAQHVRQYCAKPNIEAIAPCEYGTHNVWSYRDPLCLLAMALESYAFFLIQDNDPRKIAFAQEVFQDALHIGTEFFGINSSHVIAMLNNMGVRCIWVHKYDLAIDYIQQAIDRAKVCTEAQKLLPGYYCNLAEAYFHNKQQEKAQQILKLALDLARTSRDETLVQHVIEFQKDMNKEMGKSWINWLW